MKAKIGLAWGGGVGYCPRLAELKEQSIMSRICDICGKGAVKGSSILRRGQSKKSGGIGQHVTAITKRMFEPNLQQVRAKVNGQARRMKVCTACIRSGRVEKAA